MLFLFFPLLQAPVPLFFVGKTVFRRQEADMASVHGLCTRSTKAMYSEYKARVLAVQEPCTAAGSLCLFLRNASLTPSK